MQTEIEQNKFVSAKASAILCHINSVKNKFHLLAENCMLKFKISKKFKISRKNSKPSWPS